MELNFNKLDWREPPYILKEKIDQNFELTKQSIALLSKEIKASHPKLDSSNDNIIIHEPKGIGNVHKIKLNSKVSIDSMKAKSITVESGVIQNIETQNINLEKGFFSNDRISLGLFNYDTNNESLTIGDKPEFRLNSFKRTRVRITPQNDSSNYQSIVIQSGEEIKSKRFNDENVHFTVKGDGCIGMQAFHGLVSTLTIGGRPDAQLTLKSPYTPSKTPDKVPVGTLAWDTNNLYLKTEEGWKKVKLEKI